MMTGTVVLVVPMLFGWRCASLAATTTFHESSTWVCGTTTTVDQTLIPPCQGALF